jgi:hypothetical protein
VAKKSTKKPKPTLTPADIVHEWHDAIVKALKPWHLEPKCFTFFEPKLRKKIKKLQDAGQTFTPQARRNSLRVAKDAARICKILQPKPFRKEVRFDTFQVVLGLCSQHHLVCDTGGGGGGWCNLNS